MTANQINYQRHLEDVRHNVEMERQGSRTIQETERSNRAKETETYRSNVANENIKQQTNVINALTQEETARHNLASEGLTARSIAVESSKANAQWLQANTAARVGAANVALLGEQRVKVQEETATEVAVRDAKVDLMSAQAESARSSASASNSQNLYNLERTQGQTIDNAYKAEKIKAEIAESKSKSQTNVSQSVRNYAGVVGDLVQMGVKLIAGGAK